MSNSLTRLNGDVYPRDSQELLIFPSISVFDLLADCSTNDRENVASLAKAINNKCSQDLARQAITPSLCGLLRKQLKTAPSPKCNSVLTNGSVIRAMVELPSRWNGLNVPRHHGCNARNIKNNW